MSDITDITTDNELHNTSEAIKAIHNRKPTAAITGYCLECGKPLDDERRWCDNFCRDGWQRWNPGK